MKANVKNISELLNAHFTTAHRGILITILLLREDDPYLTLAKLKRDGKIFKSIEDLIWLHEQNYIEWSGYKAAKKKSNEENYNPHIIEIIDFMNRMYGTPFKAKGVVESSVRARLKDYSIDDIKLVIANRYSLWKNDPVMSKFLTPHTIFRPSKFEKYIVEARRTQEGSSLVSAIQNDLKIGDEITSELSHTLIDDAVYLIRIDTFKGFKRLGQGSEMKKFGKDIKRLLNSRFKVATETIKVYYQGN